MQLRYSLLLSMTAFMFLIPGAKAEIITQPMPVINATNADYIMIAQRANKPEHRGGSRAGNARNRANGEADRERPRRGQRANGERPDRDGVRENGPRRAGARAKRFRDENPRAAKRLRDNRGRVRGAVQGAEGNAPGGAGSFAENNPNAARLFKNNPKAAERFRNMSPEDKRATLENLKNNGIPPGVGAQPQRLDNDAVVGFRENRPRLARFFDNHPKAAAEFRDMSPDERREAIQALRDRLSDNSPRWKQFVDNHPRAAAWLRNHPQARERLREMSADDRQALLGDIADAGGPRRFIEERRGENAETDRPRRRLEADTDRPRNLKRNVPQGATLGGVIQGQ